MNGNQVIVMTADDLKEFAANVVRETIAAFKSATSCVAAEPEYVYGLRGIRSLFNVSHATAQRYKDTFLKPAVEQRGRNIRVDANLARQLFDENRNQ